MNRLPAEKRVRRFTIVFFKHLNRNNQGAESKMQSNRYKNNRKAVNKKQYIEHKQTDNMQSIKEKYFNIKNGDPQKSVCHVGTYKICMPNRNHHHFSLDRRHNVSAIQSPIKQIWCGAKLDMIDQFESDKKKTI